MGVGAFAVAGSERSSGFLVDEVGGVLVLSGTLGRGHAALLEHIHPLAGKHRVMIRSGQGAGGILLDPEAVFAVFRMAVDDVPGDAEHRILLCYQRAVISPGPKSGGYGWGNAVGAGISRVDPVVLENQGLVPMLLRPEGACSVFCQVHLAAALVDSEALTRKDIEELRDYFNQNL